MAILAGIGQIRQLKQAFFDQELVAYRLRQLCQQHEVIHAAHGAGTNTHLRSPRCFRLCKPGIHRPIGKLSGYYLHFNVVQNNCSCALIFFPSPINVPRTLI